MNGATAVASELLYADDYADSAGIGSDGYVGSSGDGSWKYGI